MDRKTRSSSELRTFHGPAYDASTTPGLDVVPENFRLAWTGAALRKEEVDAIVEPVRTGSARGPFAPLEYNEMLAYAAAADVGAFSCSSPTTIWVTFSARKEPPHPIPHCRFAGAGLGAYPAWKALSCATSWAFTERGTPRGDSRLYPCSNSRRRRDSGELADGAFGKMPLPRSFCV